MGRGNTQEIPRWTQLAIRGRSEQLRSWQQVHGFRENRFIRVAVAVPYPIIEDRIVL